MKKFKKISMSMATLLAVSAAPISVIACEDKEDSPTIVVSVTSDSYNYPKAISQFAKQEAEKRGYSVQIIVTDENPQKEQNQILQLISTRNVKGVVLIPSKKDGSAVTVKKINEKNVPVVIIDRGINKTNATKLLGSITTDNVKAAEKLVEYAKNNFAANIGGVYIANGEAGGDSANDRKTGFDNGLSQHLSSASVLQKKDTPGWDQVNAQNTFASVAADTYSKVTSGKKLLILSAAIPMTNGIVTAAGFNKQKSIVIGFDIDKSNTTILKDGKLQAAGMQRPDIMSAWAVAKLNMKINNHSEKVEKEKYYTNKDFQAMASLAATDVKLPITIITANNINEIVYG